MSIDADGNILTLLPMAGSSIRTSTTLYAPFYDAVPFGTPDDHRDGAGRHRRGSHGDLKVGDTLNANVGDNLRLRLYTKYQHDRRSDHSPSSGSAGFPVRRMARFVGATGANFKITTFLVGIRWDPGEPSYIDGKGSTRGSLLRRRPPWSHCRGNTPPSVVRRTAVQRHPEHDRDCSTSRSTISLRSPRSSTTARRCRVNLVYTAVATLDGRLVAWPGRTCPSHTIRPRASASSRPLPVLAAVFLSGCRLTPS